MDPNAQDSGGAATEAPADTSEHTSPDTEAGPTDFGEGFASDIEDLISDVPQDVGTSEPEAAPTDAQEADPEPQPAEPEQPPAETQVPPSQPQESSPQQGASLNLDSGAPLDQLLQTLTQNEQHVVQAAADNLFKLSDEDKEALETDAVAAMPVLAGKVYVKSLQAATSLVRNMVPQMLQQEMARQTSLMAAEQAFFAQYPELDKWKHGADIVAVGQHFKAQNPNMPAQELLQRIATAVMGMHGIQRKPQQARGNGQQPFRPAQSGPSRGQPLPSDNPFAGLGMDFEE